MAYSAKYTPKPITDIFTSDTDINRRQCRRTVPTKVLLLGLGRTGTACTFHFPHLPRALSLQLTFPSNACSNEAARLR